MKINPPSTAHALGVQGAKPTRKAAKAPKLAGKDQASFSREAQVIAKAKEALAKVPPTRSERIESLRTAIARGDYKVDARILADRLLDLIDG